MEVQSNNYQNTIKEAIRKIALGRSIDRIELSPSGTNGIGTARLIHGYVAKIHDNPSDEEYTHYAGTIDVGEFPDETASNETIIHKGVLLSGLKNNSGGFLIIPYLFSDVTIVMDAGTKNCYIVNYSHAKLIQLKSHDTVTIGVSETEELNTNDEDSPDYNELQETGNKSFTQYEANKILHSVENKKGNLSNQLQTPDKIESTIEKTNITQTGDKVVHKTGNTSFTITETKISLGDENATEPLVLGNELAQLMMEFITECCKITTPTMLGTMPVLNMANFNTLTPKIQKFLSKTSFTK